MLQVRGNQMTNTSRLESRVSTLCKNKRLQFTFTMWLAPYRTQIRARSYNSKNHWETACLSVNWKSPMNYTRLCHPIWCSCKACCKWHSTRLKEASFWSWYRRPISLFALSTTSLTSRWLIKTISKGTSLNLAQSRLSSLSLISWPSTWGCKARKYHSKKLLTLLRVTQLTALQSPIYLKGNQSCRLCSLVTRSACSKFLSI